VVWRNLVGGEGRAASHVAGKKLVDQPMQAGLAAEVLEAGTDRLGLEECTDAELSVMLLCGKPMICLLALDAADVADDGVSDHSRALLGFEAS